MLIGPLTAKYSYRKKFPGIRYSVLMNYGNCHHSTTGFIDSIWKGLIIGTKQQAEAVKRFGQASLMLGAFTLATYKIKQVFS